VKSLNCCQRAARGGDDHRRPASVLRCGRDAAGWVVPGAVLALVPKCPACVAAYVALATGVTLSAPVATFARTSVIVLCTVSLSFAALRVALRIVKR
jgi:hypothetical protein